MRKRRNRSAEKRIALLDAEEGERWREVSAPRILGQVEVRVYHGRRMLLLTLYGMAEARAVIDALCDGKRMKWVTDTIASVKQCVIMSDDLDAVMRYSGDVPDLPEPYASHVERIAGRVVTRAVQKDDAPIRIRTKVPKAPDGAIPIATIAQELGMEARDARAVLRRHKVAKPYAWIDTTEIVRMLKKSR
jgi:hypothetical protein